MSHKSRSRLNLESFECRLAPATLAQYLPATQNLKLSAAEGDTLEVRAIAGAPVGYVTVTETGTNTEVFNSITKAQPVNGLFADLSFANTASLLIGPAVKLGGPVNVWGALQTSTFTLQGQVGGGVSYKDLGGANDTVVVEDRARVGSGLTLNLSQGTNTVQLRQGFVGGNLNIGGKDGADTVEVLADGDFTVGGSINIKLGNGANSLTAKGSYYLFAGTDFNYAGFAGTDDIDFETAVAWLSAGGKVNVTLGGPFAAAANRVQFDRVFAGSIALTGGKGPDDVRFGGGMTVAGDVTFSAGDGANYLDFNAFSSGVNTIGGKVGYTGGVNVDQVYMDGTTVGKGVLVDLKDASAAGQFFTVGEYMTAGVRIYGSLGVKGGAGADTIDLARLYVAGKLIVDTGAGGDTVKMNDTLIGGTAGFFLGAGIDTLEIEAQANDGNNNALDGLSSFASPVTVMGGAGADTLNLSDDNDATTNVSFGSPVKFDGGADADTLSIGLEVTFFGGPKPTTF